LRAVDDSRAFDVDVDEDDNACAVDDECDDGNACCVGSANLGTMFELRADIDPADGRCIDDEWMDDGLDTNDDDAAEDEMVDGCCCDCLADRSLC
jgi:hypothetical protein